MDGSAAKSLQIREIGNKKSAGTPIRVTVRKKILKMSRRPI